MSPPQTPKNNYLITVVGRQGGPLVMQLLELVLDHLAVCCRPIGRGLLHVLYLAVDHLQPPVRPTHNAVLPAKLLEARQANA